MSDDAEADVVHAGQGKEIAAAGDLDTFLAEGEDTGRSHAIREAVVPPGGGPPPHVPRGVVHTSKNEADADARMLLLVAPAGMEKMFEEMGHVVTDPSARPSPPTPEEMEEMAPIAPKYGIEIRPNG